jgi:sugar phosphate isomerase/epimerase
MKKCPLQVKTILALAIAAVASAAIPSPTQAAAFKEDVGLQLYSLRAQFTRSVPETLPKVKAFGFKKVELAGTYNLSPEKFRSMLDEHGLDPVSGHFPFERYDKDPEAVARDAKALGLKYAGCAWIPHDGEFDEAEASKAIEVFNRAGAVLARQGIRFFYHCHGFEFRPHGDGTFMDLLMKKTDPKLVAFEMDVFWVVHPGQDPVAWLEKYPKRWELMHVKDMRKGLQGDFTGKADVKNDVAVGTGQMNWPAILKAAKKSGVKHYFIEDESPTVEEQIPQSLEYLKNVKL